ncbi:helix-turn-helix domain-containing protein [Bdellovibrionota bacterium FG-2]
MNLKFLREMADTKFGGVEAFAEALNITKQAVYKWLSGESRPDDERIFDIASALELDEKQIDHLLGVPETIVLFRNTRKQASNQATIERGKELAETFFKVGESSYSVKDSFPLTEETDPKKIASLIRSLLDIADNEPLKLDTLLRGLQKHNVGVFFLPFNKLTIRLNDRHEVAFTARQGNKVAIFADTNRTVDEITFDLCHEVCHVITRRQSDLTEEDEKICESVAEELIFPTGFFELKKQELEPILCEKSTIEETVECLFKLQMEFDWAPGGLAKALVSIGRIKAKSELYERLLKVSAVLKRHVQTVNTMYYSLFEPKNFDSLKAFFDNELPKNKQLFRPFIEIKNAASFGRISYRKLAELLVINPGDADELIKSWREDDTLVVSA